MDHKEGKKHLVQNANCKRTHFSEHMLVSYTFSGYQGLAYTSLQPLF